MGNVWLGMARVKSFLGAKADDEISYDDFIGIVKDRIHERCVCICSVRRHLCVHYKCEEKQCLWLWLWLWVCDGVSMAVAVAVAVCLGLLSCMYYLRRSSSLAPA